MSNNKIKIVKNYEEYIDLRYLDEYSDYNFFTEDFIYLINLQDLKLINCVGCLDCLGCYNCVDCYNCVGCYNCDSCSFCEDLINGTNINNN